MENIEEQTRQAYREWQQAVNLFNNAVEKEDIEYAVFNMETKKKNYIRLMHAVKSNGDSRESDFL